MPPSRCLGTSFKPPPHLTRGRPQALFAPLDPKQCRPVKLVLWISDLSCFGCSKIWGGDRVVWGMLPILAESCSTQLGGYLVSFRSFWRYPEYSSVQSTNVTVRGATLAEQHDMEWPLKQCVLCNPMTTCHWHQQMSEGVHSCVCWKQSNRCSWQCRSDLAQARTHA